MALNGRSLAALRGGAIAGVTALLLAASFDAGAASASVRFYRDSIGVRTGSPSRYLIEVPESAAMHGGYDKVETDASGRVVKTTFLEDGAPQSYTLYEYAGAARLPNRTRSYTKGALTGVATITRDADGAPVRYDFTSAQGAPTGYTTFAKDGDHVDGGNYAPDGTRRSHWEEYYSPDGAQIRTVSYTDGVDSYSESTNDPARGIETSLKKFQHGALSITYRDTYDADDDLIRQDLYNEKDVWFGAKIYEHNLITKALYKFTNGGTREVRYTYDQRRWATSTQMFENDKFVCTFVFEYLPDGAIKRTIAQGPDGSLWAEYPNIMINQVNQDGHPPNSTVGTITKVGPWW